MKKILGGLFLVASFTFATAQTISFDQNTYEYGTIKTGSDGHRFFTVTNTGDKPLIISEVKASCGCTTPEWSKDPIMPGKIGKIKVGYNTGINGPFVKNIEVFSNDPVNSRSVIYIKGNVDPNAAEPAAAKEVKDVKTTAEVKPALAQPTSKTAIAKKKMHKAKKTATK